MESTGSVVNPEAAVTAAAVGYCFEQAASACAELSRDTVSLMTAME